MAAVIIFIGTFADWENDPKIIKIIFLAAIVFSGIAIYFISCYILKCNEIVYVVDRIKKRFT
jgi:phage shock protein PspC (stress-responsive transcriptional regulator)